MTTRTTLIVLLAVLVSALAGCKPQYTLDLPDRFAQLRDDRQGEHLHYALRATTPDGVVVGVKHLSGGEVDGTLAFWTEAISRQLREVRGYALLGESELTAASGERGAVLRFGRELSGHAYRFTVVVFALPDRLVLVEMGGREEPFVALEAEVERSIAAMRL